MSIYGVLGRLLPGDGRDIVVECRQCGTTVAPTFDDCPECGATELCRYEIPQ